MKLLSSAGTQNDAVSYCIWPLCHLEKYASVSFYSWKKCRLFLKQKWEELKDHLKFQNREFRIRENGLPCGQAAT